MWKKITTTQQVGTQENLSNMAFFVGCRITWHSLDQWGGYHLHRLLFLANYRVTQLHLKNGA